MNYLNFIKYKGKPLKIQFEFWADCQYMNPINVSDWDISLRIRSSLGNDFDLFESSFNLDDPANGICSFNLNDDLPLGEFRIEFYASKPITNESIQFDQSIIWVNPYKIRVRNAKLSLIDSQKASPFYKTLIKISP